MAQTEKICAIEDIVCLLERIAELTFRMGMSKKSRSGVFSCGMPSDRTMICVAMFDTCESHVDMWIRILCGTGGLDRSPATRWFM